MGWAHWGDVGGRGGEGGLMGWVKKARAEASRRGGGGHGKVWEKDGEVCHW